MVKILQADWANKEGDVLLTEKMRHNDKVTTTIRIMASYFYPKQTPAQPSLGLSKVLTPHFLFLVLS